MASRGEPLTLGAFGCGEEELGTSCHSDSDCGTYSCIFEKTASNSTCDDITENYSRMATVAATFRSPERRHARG